MKSKYETEPEAICVEQEEEEKTDIGDIKKEGRSDRLKREIVKGGRGVKKEEMKEEVKEEISVDWDEGLGEWRVKRECKWSTSHSNRSENTQTSLQEGQASWTDESRGEAAAADIVGEVESSDKQNGHHSEQKEGRDRRREEIGPLQCALEVGWYLPPNARRPVSNALVLLSRRQGEFRMGSSVVRRHREEKIKQTKRSPERPVGFRLISTRSQRRGSSTPPNVRVQGIRSEATDEGDGRRSVRRAERERGSSRGKRTHRTTAGSGRDVGKERKKETDRLVPGDFRVHLPARRLTTHSDDSRTIGRAPRGRGE